jgi:two-component system response regulator GlrR
MKDYQPPITTSLGFGFKPKISKRRKENQSPAAESGNARILIVDDDPALCRLLRIRLTAANYEVESVSSARSAMDACARFRPHLVITDLRMEHMDGLDLLKELKGRWPELSVMILTAHGTIPEAVQATQCGAFGFLVKPIEKSELLGQVQRAIAVSNFTETNADWRAHIVSRSQLMEDRLGQANRVARSDAPVILTGESGTGKELFARAIHAASARREQPFIVVMCRSPGEDTLESELFGDESQRGAPGAFRAARGGTLLLAEIGDLPFRLQIKLVQALREEQRLSANPDTPAHSEVRLICTTSRDLKGLMMIGQFHEDLYYFINVLPIEVPTLGRRREDIPLLVSRFLEQATEEGGLAKIYSPKAVHLLVTAEWPGNVRQLFDLVKQNVALSEGKVMTEEFVQQSLGSDSMRLPSYDDARDEFSRDYLAKSLESTSGNVTKSAILAKRNRTDFYKLLSRYRLEPEKFKKSAFPGGKKGGRQGKVGAL